MNKNKVKKIIKENKLSDVSILLRFLDSNVLNYNLTELMQIAELANEERDNNAAFYTNDFIVQKMINDAPIVNQDTIRILEPSVGIGNFIIPFIVKMAPKYNHLYVDLNDIDPNSLKILKFFISISHIPDNVSITYYNYDFLSGMVFNERKYDYIIGNPPFKRISLKRSEEDGYQGILNLSGEFIDKALSISNTVIFIMPKLLLSSYDYVPVRERLSKMNIVAINDFGEKGFNGVLIETIGIVVNSNKQPDRTKVYSITFDTERILKQDYITSDNYYPNWLIYRNDAFDNVCSKLDFNIFSVFRDRQITNKFLSNKGDIRVVKSRNISRDGSSIIKISGYDSFIDSSYITKLKVGQFFKNRNVYLVPNMTYYPRIIKKDDDFLVNGSVAVLTPKEGNLLTKRQLDFINSAEFQSFYKIARNNSTRTLNIDNVSIFWFGKYIGEK